jgi:DNA-binding NtrC family response regulator
LRLAKGSGTGMTPPQPTAINILVLNETIRQHLLDILKRNQFKPVVIANPGELAAELKERTSRVIFIDYEAETQYGPAIIMNIKAASKEGGIIFLYDKDHRNLIQEVMQLGVYGCVVAPYDEWEILTMVKHLLAKKTAKLDRRRKKTTVSH